MAIRTHDPATGKTLREFDELTDAQIERVVARSCEAINVQKDTPLSERARRLQAMADILEAEATHWGRVLTEEMGKTLAAATAEVTNCASVCRHYAEHGADFLADVRVETDASRSFKKYLPFGGVKTSRYGRELAAEGIHEFTNVKAIYIK